MGIFTSQYITPQGERNTINYKYHGSDKSLFYKYVLSPLAQFCIDHIIPVWFAPNLITIIGFLCTLVPHIVILCMFPNQLAGNVPAWLCFFAAGGNFVYIVLDNADGKQARKTGSSSPLGLVFDHGCDAMNTFIASLSCFTVIQLGETMIGTGAYALAMLAFYFATWEEYYVGSLDLPIINGANEGVLALMLMLVASGIFGCEMWTYNLGGVKAGEIVFFCFIAMGIFTFASNIYNVHKRGTKPVLSAMYTLIIAFYAAFTMLFATYFLTPDNQGRVRLFVYIVGFCHAKQVGHIQVCHVANQEYHQFRKSTLFIYTTLNIFVILNQCTEITILQENYLLYGLLAYSILSYAQFVFSVTRQFCRILGINVFTLTRKECLLTPEENTRNVTPEIKAQE